MPETQLDAFDVIKQVSQHTSFDELASRDPVTRTDAELWRMIELDRAARAQWERKVAERKAKKEGATDGE